MKYEVVIKLNASRRPTLAEVNDFLFCRIRDNNLKYTVNTKADPMQLTKESNDKKPT